MGEESEGKGVGAVESGKRRTKQIWEVGLEGIGRRRELDIVGKE